MQNVEENHGNNPCKKDLKIGLIKTYFALKLVLNVALKWGLFRYGRIIWHPVGVGVRARFFPGTSYFFSSLQNRLLFQN